LIEPAPDLWHRNGVGGETIDREFVRTEFLAPLDQAPRLIGGEVTGSKKSLKGHCDQAALILLPAPQADHPHAGWPG
jgi:hypothetical protein